MSIYFVRHGQTDWNLQGKTQGQVDIPLNDQGREQAEMTRKLLENVKMDLIYTSPLQRAKETAQIINKNWNLPIMEEINLKERNFGSYEGGIYADLDKQQLWSYDDTSPFEGSEDTRSFYQRVHSFLDSIMDDAEHKNILLVAHGGVSIPYYCYFHGYDLEDYSKVMLHNCEVSKEEVKKDNVEQRG